MRIKPLTIAAILTSFFILTSGLHADVKLPAIFGDHMVLQQKATVTVWGWAEPGEKVNVKGSWQWFKKTTKADENGSWKVNVRTPKAGKRVTLTVTGTNEILLKDILIGEVWVCSGQSNMQWTMGMLGTEVSKQDIEKTRYPKGNPPRIRLFTVKRALSATPQDNCEGQWHVCTPETVTEFSATGYYFGKNLNENLNVPIGLISTNWGGTRAEAWTSQETLKDFERFSDDLETLANPEEIETKSKQLRRKILRAWETKIDRLDTGIQEKWYQPNFDDSDWNEMELPGVWSGTGLAGVDGAVWFRHYANLPPSWARNDMELHLGPIDDIDTLWVNGVKIDTTTGWDKPRVYRIPASALRAGKNSLAVRVIDTGGEGGFGGKQDDLRIGPAGADVKTCSGLANTWKYKLSHKGALPVPPADKRRINQNTATVLYNAMIAPLIPYRIAGAIWYQGESNCYDPILYRTLFPAMITDWRSHWGQGDFPFYYVQIAPYQYGSRKMGFKERSYAIREAQMMTLDAVDKVGMAVTMDIGEEKDIHPRNKHDVGDRLARWALAKTYGKKDIAYSGPLYKSMTVEDGKIRIEFDYADGGLFAKDGQLKDFMVAGANKVFVPAKAVIDGESVVVSSDAVKEPVAVRYGWSNWVDGSLFNKAGLPASSFRTDDWPIE